MSVEQYTPKILDVEFSIIDAYLIQHGILSIEDASSYQKPLLYGSISNRDVMLQLLPKIKTNPRQFYRALCDCVNQRQDYCPGATQLYQALPTNFGKKGRRKAFHHFTKSAQPVSVLQKRKSFQAIPESIVSSSDTDRYDEDNAYYPMNQSFKMNKRSLSVQSLNPLMLRKHNQMPYPTSYKDESTPVSNSASDSDTQSESERKSFETIHENAESSSVTDNYDEDNAHSLNRPFAMNRRRPSVLSLDPISIQKSHQIFRTFVEQYTPKILDVEFSIIDAYLIKYGILSIEDASSYQKPLLFGSISNRDVMVQLLPKIKKNPRQFYRALRACVNERQGFCPGATQLFQVLPANFGKTRFGKKIQPFTKSSQPVSQVSGSQSEPAVDHASTMHIEPVIDQFAGTQSESVIVKVSKTHTEPDMVKDSKTHTEPVMDQVTKTQAEQVNELASKIHIEPVMDQVTKTQAEPVNELASKTHTEPDMVMTHTKPTTDQVFSEPVLYELDGTQAAMRKDHDTNVDDLTTEAIQQFDIDLYNYLNRAKEKKMFVSFQHIKVFLTGSAAAGKTAFRHLLLNLKFSDDYNSTHVIETSHAYTLRSSAGLLESQEGDIHWYALTPEQQLKYYKSLLISHQAEDYKMRPSTHDSNDTDSARLAEDYKMHPSTHDSNDADSAGSVATSSDLPSPSPAEKRILNSDSIPLDLQIGKPVRLVTIVDTGGQPGYVDMLPAIVNCPDINFIVHDMSKDLKDPVLVRFKRKDYEEVKPYQLNFTNEDLVKLIMSFSTQSLHMSFNPLIDASNSEPYISFVGTHKDKVTNKQTALLNKQLANLVGGQQNINILGTEDPEFVLFAVDNTKTGGAQDPVVKSIRKSVQDCIGRTKCFPVPINWMIFELELQNRKESPYISVQEYLSVAKSSTSCVDDKEIVKSLQYFHFLGILLYFKDVPGLCDYVITDQQWFYNKISMFVHLPSEVLSFLSHRSQNLFQTSGILLKDELHNIKWDENISIEHFITFLVCKNLIADFSVKGKSYYYLPYVLPYCQQYIDKYQFLLSEPLLVQFSNGVLPRGFFCSLIVHLLQDLPSDWHHQLMSPTCPNESFRNVITFHLPDNFYIRMLDRIYYLELQIRHFKDATLENAVYHPQVLTVLRKYFNCVCQKLKFDLKNLQYGFLCHDRRSNDDHIAVIESLDTPLPSRLECCNKCENKTEIGKLHKIWMKNWISVKSESTSYMTSVVQHCSQLGSDRPNPKDLNTYVTPHIPADEWENLGMELLDGDTVALSSIKANATETSQRCSKMFQKWLNRRGSTWNCLIAALERVHLTYLADQIKKILTSTPTEYQSARTSNAQSLAATTRTASFMDATPEMGDLISIVLPTIKAEWEDVAYTLHYNTHTIEDIKGKHKEDPRKCCREVLADWLNATPERNDSPRTWAALLDKIKDITQLEDARKEIIKKLTEKYQ